MSHGPSENRVNIRKINNSCSSKSKRPQKSFGLFMDAIRTKPKNTILSWFMNPSREDHCSQCLTKWTNTHTVCWIMNYLHDSHRDQVTLILGHCSLGNIIIIQVEHVCVDQGCNGNLIHQLLIHTNGNAIRNQNEYKTISQARIQGQTHETRNKASKLDPEAGKALNKNCFVQNHRETIGKCSKTLEICWRNRWKYPENFWNHWKMA